MKQGTQRSFGERLLLLFCTFAIVVSVWIPIGGDRVLANSALDSNDGEIEYMRIKNLVSGVSGVALGATGGGYYEIDPAGYVTRMCVNNIHKSFVNSPSGMLVGVYDGATAVRLQRDSETRYGMKGYSDSYYTGLWPTVKLDFENSGNSVANMGFSAYSGVVAQNIKDSSLPVVFYEVELVNDGSEDKQMSAILTWADLIGRGLRDTDAANPSNLDGESAEWYYMRTPATYAKGVTLSAGGTTYTGVMQYAKDPILPNKMTFQNYNNSFMLLAEAGDGSEVSILKSFDVNNANALDAFVSNGKLAAYDEAESTLSAAGGNPTSTQQASAVSVRTTVAAGESKTVRFAVSWYMPEVSDATLETIHHMEGCDYNKYYHNDFSSIEGMTSYALRNRNEIRAGIDEWQRPILESSMPDWLMFKLINSGYTLYTNGVLNKRGNFSTLEGEMGGYGGTMDQKMASHPFYEKLFPELNLNENRQFANVTGGNGEIQHFDLHYYHGISDFDPNNRVNPTPAGSMTDNTGAWMVQMWNYYRQTADDTYLREYYDVMNTSMAFIASKCAPGTYIPNYNTTYDDYKHPDILIFSGTVYLNMLDIAAMWAAQMGDTTRQAAYEASYALTWNDVDKLYVSYAGSSWGPFYAFGSDNEYLTSDGASGNVRSEVMFSGAMAGQFMSRYSGLGDVVPFEQFVQHMSVFLRSSIQKSNDYFAPKVYNVRTEQDMDNSGSRCWPFYLDSYGGMAAIQAGYIEDGLEVLQHTMLVELRQGYMWTQNLWNPGYSTYMTAPVSHFISDVLAGSAIDLTTGTLTLGPTMIASDDVGLGESLKVTLYYPKFWATVDYRPNDGVFTYSIVKTFYEAGEAPATFREVVAAPTGKATADAKTITLGETFTITEGAVLDLSEHIADFAGVAKPKTLQPVNRYVTPAPEKIADGTGLLGTVTVGEGEDSSVLRTFSAESVNYRFNQDSLPAVGVEDTYTMTLTGRILPRYGQKYQLVFEYTGEMPEVYLNGERVTTYSESIDDIESQQFSPTPGCKLLIVTVDLQAGVFYPIQIRYQGDVSDGEDDVLRFIWWSTTQQMGLVVKERMYPPMVAFDWMRGLDYSATTAQVEGDHMAYTQKNTYALYRDIDFGTEPMERMTFQIYASAPNSDVSRGGTMEVRLGGVTGQLLGKLTFSPNGGWNNYQLYEMDMELATPISGMQDVCFVFCPTSTFLFNYTDFRFLRGYQNEEYPTEITFENDVVTKFLTDETYRNPVTVDDGKLAEALRYTSSNPSVATVDTDGTVTFHLCGETTITARSLSVERSYRLIVTVPETDFYHSDFEDGADGWQFGISGKEYDKARLDDVSGTMTVILDGSDLGNRDGVRNSWMYRAFKLEAGLEYTLKVRFRSPADAATNLRVVVVCDGMEDLATPWQLTSDDAFGVIQMDLTDYAGKLFYVYVEQDDHERGSGEIVHVYNVTLEGEEPEAIPVYHVQGMAGTDGTLALYTTNGILLQQVGIAEDGTYDIELENGEYVLRFTDAGGVVRTARVSVRGADARYDFIQPTAPQDDAKVPLGLVIGLPVGAVVILAGIAVVIVILKRKKPI